MTNWCSKCEELEGEETNVTGVDKDKVVEIARQQIGKSYKLGESGPDVFDCSGLVYYCYRESGCIPDLPRYTADGFYNNSKRITKEELAPGDLVFRRHQTGKWGHVGLYVGEGKVIHASSKNTGVKESNLNDSWSGFGRLDCK